MASFSFNVIYASALKGRLDEFEYICFAFIIIIPLTVFY